MVADVQGDQVFSQSRNGLVKIPIDASGSIDVYRSQKAHFAIGDVLSVIKNRQPVDGENTKRLNNVSLVTLQGFNKHGELQLSNGQMINPSWGHLDHGVTVTSHTSQGKTFNHVIIAQSSISFPASSPEQAYFSASRGQQDISWYTDDVAALRHAISNDHKSKMASEMQPEVATHSKLRDESLRQRAQRFAAEQFERIRRFMANQQLQQAR